MSRNIEDLISAGFTEEQATLLEKLYNSEYDFWKTVKWFVKEEFACKCGKYCNGFPVEPQEKLVRALDTIREKSGKVCIITSGVRCDKHNASLPNSAANSWHKKGFAADFRLVGLTSAQTIAIVKQYVDYIELYAIDDTHVHIAVKE